MPFTPAHPAAVLPLVLLRRPWIPTLGLVVGSMAPDFEYFLRARVFGEFGHSLLGVAAFCLPVGLVVAWFYERHARPVLELVAPASLRRSVRSAATWSWAPPQLAALSLSIVLGALTHLAWDSFTHGSGLAVTSLEVLRAPLPLPSFAGHWPAYRGLQHLSTAVGGLAGLYGLWRLRSEPTLDAGPAPRRSALRVALVLSICGGGATGALLRQAAGVGERAASIGDMLVAAVSGSLAAAALACVVTRGTVRPSQIG